MFRDFSKEEHLALQEAHRVFCEENPNANNTDRMIALNRLYERHHYGVTSRDLARGYQIRVEKVDGGYVKLRREVYGNFVVGGTGNNKVTDDATVNYVASDWARVGKKMNKIQLYRDKQVMKEIELAAQEQTTGSDILAKGKGLLDNQGIDTGYGASPGVILPQYIDYMLRKSIEKPVFGNFARVVPMPAMTFYFPLKTSKPTDSAGNLRTTAPTPEGRAGTDMMISFTNFPVNGFKFLRHAGITKESLMLLAGFIDLKQEFLDDISQMMALLWDYTICEGIWSMLVTAKWRRYDVSGAAWTDSEYVPLSGASGADMLTTNAKKFIIWQDLTPGSANYGKFYEPDTSGGNVLKYLTSTLRPGVNEQGQEIYDLFTAMATIQKEKQSELQYVAVPPKLSEMLFRDSRFLDKNQNTGNPRFYGVKGYLGQINISGSNQKLDVWEYDPLVFPNKATTDVGVYPIYTVFGGMYGQSWNQGVFSPFYMRVDDGMEVVAGIGTGASNVLRANETQVLTCGTRGASFPGDATHSVLGLCVLTQAHG